MENKNLNLSDLTSNSLLNLTDLGFSDSSTDLNQQGGFLGSLFQSNNKITNATLEAASQNNFQVVKFMIENNLIEKYDCQDKSGNTLLHYLVQSPNPDRNLIQLVIKKINKKTINHQNIDGNTPILLSTLVGNHDISALLSDNGADKNIKNNKNQSVDTETDFEKSTAAINSPIFEANVSSDVATEILNPILKIFKSSKDSNLNTSDPNTAIFDTTETQQNKDSSIFVPSNNNQTSELPTVNFSTTEGPNNNNLDTNQYINEIKQYLDGKSPEDKEKIISDLSSTENFISGLKNILSKTQPNNVQSSDSNTYTDLISKINKFTTGIDTQQKNITTGGCSCGSGGDKEQYGGKKSKKTRKVKKYIESSVTSTDSDRQYNLSRVLNTQVSDIINGVIKTIQDIIDNNKKDFKGISPDEETARAIKSLLWKSIRDSNDPNVKTALDVAVKLQSTISKDAIKKITAKEIKEMKEILQKKAEERQNRQQN